MNATDAKTQKIEPDPNLLWWTKVSEAVCKRDFHNVSSYLFFNMKIIWTKIQTFIHDPASPTEVSIRFVLIAFPNNVQVP